MTRLVLISFTLQVIPDLNPEISVPMSAPLLEKRKQIDHARTLQFEHYKNVAIRTQLTLAQKISLLN